MAAKKKVTRGVAKKKKAAPKKKAVKRMKAAPQAARGGGSVGKTCTAIEAYFDALRSGGVELYDHVVSPQSASAISGIEKKLSMSLPADVKAFLSRGLRAAEGSVKEGDRFAAIGFDWLDAKKIISSTTLIRKVAKDTLGAEDELAGVVRTGVALTWSEPQIVVADGGVYHLSFRNRLLRVADSFEEFLSAWLASGCFGSHDFDLLWGRVKSLVPVKIEPAKNSWVKAYKKQFPG